MSSCNNTMNPLIPNRIYHHFNGDYYLLIDIAKHSETGEDYVFRFLYIRKIPIIIVNKIAATIVIIMNLGSGVAIAAFMNMSANISVVRNLTVSNHFLLRREQMFVII